MKSAKRHVITLRIYERARVGIDVPMYKLDTLPPAGFIPQGIDSSLAHLHLGHARTLLLGSLIAKELGVPFHVRIDGIKRNDSDCKGILLDIMGITHFLEIHVDDCYWIRQHEPPEAFVRDKLGDKAETFWNAVRFDYLNNPIKISLIADDLLYHSPSLIVRGTEFVEPERFHPPPEGTGLATLNKWIHHLYDALEVKIHEVNVPLIFTSGSKMSKSNGPVVDWKILKSISPQDAHAFLVATAVNPYDPLAVIGKPFRISDLAYEPYEWDWQVWTEFVRMVG